QLLDRSVRSHVAVAIETEEWRDQVVEETALVGGGQAAVALNRDLVLLGAPDPPALGGDRLVLAHRQSGTRLLVPRDGGHHLPRAQPAEQSQTARGRARTVEVEEHSAQLRVQLDRS